MTSSKERKVTNFSIDSIMGRPQVAGTSPASIKVQQHEHGDKNGNNNKGQVSKKSRPKNFGCPVCPMAFSNNGQLRNHVRIHTGERPFKCNFDRCGKTFTRNEELTRHKLIHSGVRPHACPNCGKRFGRKDHLKKHARTHSTKRITRRGVAKISSLGADVSAGSSTIDKNKLKTNHDKGQQVVSSPKNETLIDTSTHLHHFHQATTPTTTTVAAPAFAIKHPNDGRIHEQLGHIASIQQLASDYWSSWYTNLLRYHQYCQTTIPNQDHYGPAK